MVMQLDAMHTNLKEWEESKGTKLEKKEEK
jgi:hypothetical protein